MFYIDLDELQILKEKIWTISHNRFNLFNFRDTDHLHVSKNPTSVKEEIIAYCQNNGVESFRIKKVMLLTNLRTLGYQFNPVSFYYCFTENNEPLCCVAEIGNTFGEMKLFFLGAKNLESGSFQESITKYFYVSPFMDMDTDFDFNLSVPKDKLRIRIDDYKDGNHLFMSTLSGHRETLNNWTVFKNALRFPFVTLQVIVLIHWQALLLWIKRIKYNKKTSFMELQKQVLKPHKSLAK